MFLLTVFTHTAANSMLAATALALQKITPGWLRVALGIAARLPGRREGGSQDTLSLRLAPNFGGFLILVGVACITHMSKHAR